jgi:hypothetical protein
MGFDPGWIVTTVTMENHIDTIIVIEQAGESAKEAKMACMSVS